MRNKFLKAAPLGLALSMSSLANAGVIEYTNTVLANNPFLFYQFEENQGATVAVDSAGGDQNGAYIGSVALGGTESGSPIGLGNSVLLDGNSYIDVSSLGSFSQLTIEAWINLDGLAAGCCTSIFSTDTWTTNVSGSSFHYNIKSGRDLEHAVNSVGNVNSVGGVLQNDTWYHIVSTYDSSIGVTQMYVDGNLIKSQTRSGTQLAILDSQIGAWGGSRGFTGHIDEFALYDTVLTSEQISAHYSAAKSVPEPSTLAIFALGLMGLASRRFKKQA